MHTTCQLLSFMNLYFNKNGIWRNELHTEFKPQNLLDRLAYSSFRLRFNPKAFEDQIFRIRPRPGQLQITLKNKNDDRPSFKTLKKSKLIKFNLVHVINPNSLSFSTFYYLTIKSSSLQSTKNGVIARFTKNFRNNSLNRFTGGMYCLFSCRFHYKIPRPTKPIGFL